MNTTASRACINLFGLSSLQSSNCSRQQVLVHQPFRGGHSIIQQGNTALCRRLINTSDPSTPKLSHNPLAKIVICSQASPISSTPPLSSQQKHQSVQAKVKELAECPITPVTLEYLMSIAASKDLAKCASFVYREIPKRVARRIRDMEYHIPYIVGVNPHIRDVYSLYVKSFKTLTQLPLPVDRKEQQLLCDTLRELTIQHQDVIHTLAQGFKECGKYMSKEKATAFLDGMIHARIGIRVIAEHYLTLARSPPDQQPSESFLGVVNTQTSPTRIAESVASHVHDLCVYNYGSAPGFRIVGHKDVRMTYIGNHLEYILMELIKNSMRATVEHSEKICRIGHPDLEIAVSNDESNVFIRLRDSGGGISASDLPLIWDYSFTTVKSQDSSGDNIFSDSSRQAMIHGTGGPIAGLGFGLCISRIYAKYFYGHLDLHTVPGIGTDVFLRIPNISGLRIEV